MKKYRVNASEYTNLCSMYDRLKCEEIEMIEAPLEVLIVAPILTG